MIARTTLLLAALLLPTLAFASSGLRHLSVPIGQTRLVNLSETVDRIEVSNPDVLSAEKTSDGMVVLSPKATGKAHVYLHTTEDSEVSLLVFVTSGGEVELIR